MDAQNNVYQYTILILLGISLIQFLYVNVQKNSQDAVLSESKNRIKHTSEKLKLYLERLEKNVKSGKIKQMNEDFETFNQQLSFFEKEFKDYTETRQSQLQDVTLALERYEEILNEEYKKGIKYFKNVGVIDDYEKKLKELKDQVNVSFILVHF